MIGGGLLGTRFKEERRKKAEMEGDRIRQVGRMREGERSGRAGQETVCGWYQMLTVDNVLERKEREWMFALKGHSAVWLSSRVVTFSLSMPSSSRSL
jgi:hypothetical protein